ncbi:MAG: SIS domain-containing protein [Clostridia bacterium]|jgi:D-sedoheptulose 7-phosphate isomerase|nr:SIS domain-containing protein [Clostridia bacterium]MDD4275762.1 SIS domain-containing protein [Clostridia bacterium]
MKTTTSEIIEKFIERIPQLDYLKEKIINVVNEICLLKTNSNKIMLCGNGGSAADCEHMAGELNKSFMLKRRITDDLFQKLLRLFPNDSEKFVNNLQQSIPCIPFTSFISTNTAYINDCDPDLLFAQLLYSLGQKNDILICFTTSGNSKNVLYSAKLAKVLGIKIISFTGENGGKIKTLSDINLNVPSECVYLIQELHIPLYHLICLAVENELFS